MKECRFWSTGFVALLRNNRLIAVSRYEEPRPRLLADSQPHIEDSIIHAWALVPPVYTLSRHVEVLVSTGATIIVVDPMEAQNQVLQNGPFAHIAVSPNGKFVALCASDGKLWVIKADFQEKLCEYDSGLAGGLPRDMGWCGNDALVLAWENEVHLVGPRGNALKYYYDSRVHIIPEIDGVRIISAGKCEFFQKVPDVVEDIFKIGATTPASILLDAVNLLERKSPKADDNVQLIRVQLPQAVDACIRAAGCEFSVYWQKQLLRAASFGKSVLDLYSSDDFVDMCQTLRVLNAVRFYEIGLPLTYEQFIRLTPEHLIQRLVNRGHHLLALRVSEFVKIPTDCIYIHWACMKVKVSADDEDSICRMITTRLSEKRGISFEKIAQTAYDEGRGSLATRLLNSEPRAGRQVPLLLSMKEDEIALDKAIESGDTDLVFFVLLHLKTKHTLTGFFHLVNPRPFATALIETSAAEADPELLKDFYYQDDRTADSAYVFLEEALAPGSLEAKVEKLKIAGTLLSNSKEYSFEARALEEVSKLLQAQEISELELDQDTDSIGLSLNETIFQLIQSGYFSRANKLKSDFKIPEKRYCWLRLRALVAKRNWDEIEDIGKSRKSAIGWMPFFNECCAAGNTKLASGFISKCAGLRPMERVEMWIKCGMVLKAGEEALRVKDVRALELLASKAPAENVSNLQEMLKQLKPAS